MIGLSGLRTDTTFEELPIGERLKEDNTAARCGLLVIDVRARDVVHWLRIEGIVEQLYDAALVPEAIGPWPSDSRVMRFAQCLA